MCRKTWMKRTICSMILVSLIGIMMTSGCGSATDVGETEATPMENSAQSDESTALEASKSDMDPNGENAENEHSPLYISESVVKKDGSTTAKTDVATDLPLLSKVDTWPEEVVERKPYDTEMTGCVGGYFLIPMDGGIYRYDDYSSSVEAMTAQGISMATDELIFTCTEKGISEDYDYEIYSLKAYPDKDLLLANCMGYHSIIISYAPAQGIRDGELEDAQENDFVIRKNGSVISGKELWQEFCGKVAQGQPAVVRLGYYYTLEKRNMSEELREAEKADFPCLFLQQLYYDGSSFTLSPVHKLGEEYVIYEKPQIDSPERTYSYLMHYADEAENAFTSYTAYDKYVLTNSDQVTWKELQQSVLSSSSVSGYIQHQEVYGEYVWKEGMEQ
ncbi:MAG: hypothetical protein IJU80_12445 [Lachnospiraceae bacterium]|nr:hypothetical protein [Lachnospiraceae bacterium]